MRFRPRYQTWAGKLDLWQGHPEVSLGVRKPHSAYKDIVLHQGRDQRST
jgi:hypothetical protein